VFFLSRIYYKHQRINNIKEEALQRAKGFLLGGFIVTLIGIMMLIFSSSFTFFMPFNFLGGIFSLFAIIPFIMGGIFFIVGISSFIEAKNMSNEETVPPAIEYVRSETKEILKENLEKKRVSGLNKNLKDLVCPACNAPLNKKPPCKCDYCGRMIRSI